MAFYHYALLIIAASQVVVATGTGSKCECALFKEPTPDVTKESPVASKSPNFEFECTEAGKKDCLNMCLALANAAKKDEAPNKICDIVDTSSEPFVPMVYYKACDDDFYTNTGIKSALKVCCKDKVAIACP